MRNDDRARRQVTHPKDTEATMDQRAQRIEDRESTGAATTRRNSGASGPVGLLGAMDALSISESFFRALFARSLGYDEYFLPTDTAL